MFHQLLTPVNGNLLLSFLVASIPVVVVLLLLGVIKRPAWQASIAGLVTALIIACTVWQFPVALALDSTAAGIAFALWNIMWIVFSALTLYNIAVQTGRFDAFRRWILENLPDDRRIILVVIGYCFGALLEGVTGFGAPVAITSSLLIMLGFKPLDAIVYSLIFNTAPVAFGSLGVPITTLAGVTGLPDTQLGAMIGRQLPFLAFALPFYAIGMYGGLRSIKALFPVLLVAGLTGSLAQFVTSNYISFALTNIVSALVSLLATVGFLKIWSAPVDPAYAVEVPATGIDKSHSHVSPWNGWTPWAILSVVVFIWTIEKVPLIGAQGIHWPALHNQVFISLYNKPYAAIWSFQPLGTGSAIMASAILTGLATGVGIGGFFQAAASTWKQIRLPLLTVTAIVGLAYLMNYSGLTYTLGLGVASVGAFFPLLSAFLGWLAVFMSGSDSTGNAMFGNLQVVAARQLNLSPILIAATNSSGGVMAKMISPQNIATGCATSNMKGHEGNILARTFWHSVVLTLLLGCLVWLQQFVWPWMIVGH